MSNINMTKKIRKKWIKWVAIGLAVVIVVGGGITIYKASTAGNSAVSTTTFMQSAARSGNMDVTVSGTGTVSDASDYSLTSANAGTIISLPVKQGDTVTAGETIAQINDPASAQQVSQRQSSLQSAENTLAQAQANLNSLYIVAPVAGTVKSIVPSAGDSLATDKEVSNNLAVISTNNQMTVTVSVTSSQMSSVSVGTAVNVADNINNQTYSGKVTGVSSQGGSESATVTIYTDVPGVGDSVSVNSTGSPATLIGTGTLALADYVAIPNPGSGTITNVYVIDNQSVTKNENLFKLDGTSMENNITADEAAVTDAQNQLAAAQTAQSKDTITSPINGVIAQLDVSNGGSVTQGADIATIIDPDAMQTVVSVDESDISKVQAGQQANITVSSITGTTFTGEVAEVNPIGTSNNGVTDYNVTVTINNPAGVLIGMTTTANIITQSKDNTIVVPSSAVLEHFGSTGYVIEASKVINSSGTSVQLDNMNTFSLIQKYGTRVTIGLTNSTQDEITSGVSAGDKACYTDYSQ